MTVFPELTEDVEGPFPPLRPPASRVAVSSSIETRDWAKWNLLHPYVKHPRQKHEPPAELKYLEGSPKYHAYMEGHSQMMADALKSGLSAKDALNRADRVEMQAKKTPRGPSRAKLEGIVDALREHAATVTAGPPVADNIDRVTKQELHQADSPRARIEMKWLDAADQRSTFNKPSPEHFQFTKGFSGARSLAARQSLSTDEAAKRAVATRLAISGMPKDAPGVPAALGVAAGYEAHARDVVPKVVPSVSVPERVVPLAKGNRYVPQSSQFTKFNEGHAQADSIIKSEESISGHPKTKAAAAEARDNEIEKAEEAQRKRRAVGESDANKDIVTWQKLYDEQAYHEGMAARFSEITGEGAGAKTPEQMTNDAEAEAMAGSKDSSALVKEAAEAWKQYGAARKANHYADNDEAIALKAREQGLMRAANAKAITEAQSHKSLAPKTGWRKLTPKQAHQVVKDRLILGGTLAPGGGLARLVNTNGTGISTAEREAERLSTTHETHIMSDGSLVHFNKATKVSAAKQKITLDTVADLQLFSGQKDKLPLEVFAGSSSTKWNGKVKRFGKGVRGWTYLGRPQIWVSPATMKTAEQKIQDFQVREHYFMPAGKDVDAARYVLAHEFGHSIDQSHTGWVGAGLLGQPDPVKQARQNVPTFKDDISKYGLNSPAETFAEAYAEWFLSDGKTTNPTVKKIAEAAGWTAYSLDASDLGPEG